MEPIRIQDLSSMVDRSPAFKKDALLLREQKDKDALLLKEKGEERKTTIQEVREAVNQINGTMYIYRTELRFVLHEESGEITVKVINSETQEVIREIPPEWVLKIVANVKKMLGLMLDRFI